MEREGANNSFQNIALEVLKARELRAEQTRKAAKFQITRLIKHFGNISITDMSEDLWTEYVISERANKNRKFYDDRKWMRIILHYAKRKNLLHQVPELPIPDLPWDAGREILPHELRALECSANRTLRFQIRIGWKMGLRLSEMMSLRWDQIDFVRRTVRLGAKNTKTKKAREVPIPDDLIPEFLARLSENTASWVFPSPGVGDRPQRNNKTAWRKCKARVGVTARFHDLRHTCATLLLRRGVPMHVAKKYLGMSELVLNRVYLHLSLEDLRKAADAMSDRSAS